MSVPAHLSPQVSRGNLKLRRLRRELLQRLLLFPLVRWVCRPLVVVGRSNLGDGPYLFVCNHASHADTALILAALPPRLRKRLRPAAAEDYFFDDGLRRAIVPLLTNAFAFPRNGEAGIETARQLLAAGDSILLFPEGTRSRDGEVGRFRSGAARLATSGATVVPVAIAGQEEVLPKGTWIPRQSSVTIELGRPRRYTGSIDDVGTAMRADVCALRSSAASSLRPPRRSWFRRAHALAAGRVGVVLAFAWGVVEALWWPIVPDFLVALLAIAAPRRALRLAVAATAGSAIGGATAFGIGGAVPSVELLPALPLITEAMAVQADAWLSGEGAPALLDQPLSGIPYKVFAYQAHEAGVGFAGFVLFSAVARGVRLCLVALFFAGLGRSLRRFWPHVYGAFVTCYAVAFGVGLSSVVTRWR